MKACGTVSVTHSPGSLPGGHQGTIICRNAAMKSSSEPGIDVGSNAIEAQPFFFVHGTRGSSSN